MTNYTHASNTGAYALTMATIGPQRNRKLLGAAGVYAFTPTHPKTISVAHTARYRVVQTYAALFGFPRALTEHLALHLSESTVRGHGAAITELLKLHATSAYPFTSHKTLTDFLRTHATLLTGFLARLTEHVGLHETSLLARTVHVLDALSVTPSTHTQMIYNLSILQLARFHGTLSRFLGGALTEHLGMSGTLVRKFVGNPVIGEGLGLHDILGRSLVFRIVTTEHVNVHESELLRMILHGTLSDGIQLSAAYVSPGGTFTTWAVNTRTGYTTEYTNWQFNSFAQINGKYIGANATGLYELNGESDSGINIVADIKSGLMQLGGSNFTSFKAAYLGVRGSSTTLVDGAAGQFFLKLKTGDGRFFTYEINARDMKTTKVNLGKGLRARYFSYQLTSTGQDFDLDSIEFLPIVEQRRV